MLNIKLITAKFKTHQTKNETSVPFAKYLEVNDGAAALLMDTNEILKPESLRLVFNNYFVNLVTSVEVYFREAVIAGNRWNVEGYENLLKEKIPLSEAYNLFGAEKVTRQYIIAHTSSFKNFDSIGHVFTNLIGVDFYKEIEKLGGIFDDASGIWIPENLVKARPNWRKDIVKLYELRNQFVHEGIMHDLSGDEVVNNALLVADFIRASDQCLSDKLGVFD